MPPVVRLAIYALERVPLASLLKDHKLDCWTSRAGVNEA